MKILFVCLGNICRSPLAEGAFRVEAEKRGLAAEADSAGTGDWHVGEAPDKRAIAVAEAHGVDVSAQRARKVSKTDFRKFDYVIALDMAVLAQLREMRPDDAEAELSLFLDHVEGRAGEDVADPYYGEEAGFGTCWADCVAGAEALVEKLGK